MHQNLRPLKFDTASNFISGPVIRAKYFAPLNLLVKRACNVIYTDLINHCQLLIHFPGGQYVNTVHLYNKLIVYNEHI